MARKKRLKIALIGYGAISQTLFDVFAEKKPAIDVVGVLVRPGRAKATQKKVGRKVAAKKTAVKRAVKKAGRKVAAKKTAVKRAAKKTARKTTGRKTTARKTGARKTARKAAK